MTSIYPSSSSKSSTSSANLLRISGMASGIDTDSVVKSMVSNYQSKIDKANQDRQIVQWKQEAYRNIIKDVKGLQDYFDPISDKYMLSGKSLNVNSATSDTTSVVSATAGSGAKAGTYKVHVTQLAEQAKITGTTSLNSLVNIVDNTATKLDNWKGATLNVDSNVTLGNVTDITSLVDGINSKISADATLNGKIIASYDAATSKIKFENKSNSDTVLNVKDSSNVLLISSQTIGASSSYEISVADATAWSGANLTITNSIKLDNPIPDTTGSTGIGVDDVVANINNKISQNSILSGKVSASYVNDGSGKSYIKFTSASSMNLSATTSGGTAGDIVLNQSVNSGIASSTKLSDLGITSGSFDLSYGSTTSQISVTSSDTLQTLIDKVSSKTNGAVTMSIDDNTGLISFQSKSYGSGSSISIKNLTGNMINNKLGISADSKTGKDAIVEITEPGKTVATTSTQGSNNFTVNGVTYNLVGNSEVGKTSNVTVTANSDTVVSNVKKFIDDYNKIVSEINTKLTEKKNKDYAPLTDDQKENMSESQITAWESKAKVGILRNDDNLNSLMQELRGTFNSAVYSSYTSTNTTDGKVPLTFGQYGTNAVGIDTSTDTTDGGKLVLKDEAKLKDAIENHLEDFKKFFIGTSDATLGIKQSYIGSKKYYEEGIFTRMDNILRGYVAAPGLGKDGTYSLSGSMNIFVNKQYDYTSSGSSSNNTLPDQVYSKTISVTKYTTQLKDAQTRYYAKFTALETAMSKLNAQQSSLSSMLGTN